MKSNITRGIQFAGLVAIVCTLIEKLLGLLREIKLAETLGVSASSDAYNVAYLLIVTLFGLFSTAYSNSLMPTVAELYVNNIQKMQNTVNQIVVISIIIMLSVIGIIYLNPIFFIKLMVAGLNNETILIAKGLIKISVWALIPLVLNSAYTIVLRIYNKNLYPTITELLFPIPILFVLFFGVNEPKILISCIVLGYILRTVFLIVGVNFSGFKIRFLLFTHNNKIREFFILMPPMLLSSGLLQINTLVDNQVVSRFGVGSVTALSLASKVNGLAYTVFSTSLMQIIYSSMSKLYVSNNMKEYELILKKQIRLILSFVVPCFIILYIFSSKIMEILFVRGNYTIKNAEESGEILKGYAVGLIIFVLRDICIYIYYSAKNSKFPSIVSGFSVCINIVLNIIFSYFMGIKGIAYATSVSAIFSLIFLRLYMKKKLMKISLIERNDMIIMLVAGIISCIISLKMKKLFVNYSVWVNIFSFVIVFVIFWFISIGGKILIRKYKDGI